MRKSSFWRRSTAVESTSSDTPSCSENVRSYAKRRNSDAHLSGHQLARLKTGMRYRKQSLPSTVSSGSGHTLLARSKSVQKDPCQNATKENPQAYSRKMSFDSSVKNIFQADPFSTDTNKKNSILKSSSANDIGSGNYYNQTDNSNGQIVYQEESFHRKDVNFYITEEPESASESPPSKIMDIFRSVMPDGPDHVSRISSSQNSVPSRRFSEVSCDGPPRDSCHQVKPSRRGIKLVRPDHSQTMYISGADTLGALPEVDDSRVLAHSRRLGYDMNKYFNNGRRLSCPVIHEGPETNDGASSTIHQRARNKDRLFTSLPKQSDSDLSSDETLNKEASSRKNLEYCGYSGREAFGENSYSSRSSDEVAESCITTMLGNVSFIVAKRRKNNKSVNADNERNISSSNSSLSPALINGYKGDNSAKIVDNPGVLTSSSIRSVPFEAKAGQHFQNYRDMSDQAFKWQNTGNDDNTEDKSRRQSLSDSSESLCSLDKEAGSSPYYSDVSSGHN